MLKGVIATIALGLALNMGAGSCVASSGLPPPDHVAFTGTKGINIHGWLTWTEQTSPSSYRMPVFAHAKGRLDDREIAGLKKAGFTFVRLTVDPGVFVLLSGSARDDALRSLTDAIDRLRAGGLSVIVDMHPVRAVFPFGAAQGGGQHAYEKGPQSPFAQRYATAIAWLAGQLDRRYATTRQIAFELMNEPDLRCGDPLWTTQVIQLHKAVRAAAPRVALVLNGACWDGIDGLIALDPAAIGDDNVLYTFHFYESHDFTHGGLNGGASPSDRALSALGGLPYPGDARPRAQVLDEIATTAQQWGSNVKADALDRAQRYLGGDWDRARIEVRMGLVANWAAAHSIAPSRILLGEFGVNGRRGAISGQRDDDRLRWLSDVREAAEARGFRWALWQYRGNGLNDAFELETSPHGPLSGGMLQALRLGAAQQ